jgi:hypothetical protein
MAQWSKYDSQIGKALNKNPDINNQKLAEKLLGLKRKRSGDSVDLLRTYISRHRKKLKRKQSPAKVLIFDLETAPNKGYFWGLWEQNIQTSFVIENWFLLSWSAKWLFEDEICMLEEADVVIAHNLNKFDKKRAQTRFMMNGLQPPSSYLQIDTLQHARKSFAFPSNRLDALGEYLGVGRKMETPKGLWMDIMQCTEAKHYKSKAAAKKADESLDIMVAYCNQDVLLLEDVYIEIRGYVKPHPNIGLFSHEEGMICPTCGSTHLKIVGEYHTTANSYDEYRCEYGHTSRARKANTSIKNNKGVMSSLPR